MSWLQDSNLILSRLTLSRSTGIFQHLKEVHVEIPIPTLKYGSLTLYELLLESIPSKVDEIICTLANNCFNIIPNIYLFIMCAILKIWEYGRRQRQAVSFELLPHARLGGPWLQLQQDTFCIQESKSLDFLSSESSNSDF